MTNEPGKPLPVVYTPEFKRSLRQLAKKYRHIREDIQPIINELASGSKPGDQITGIQYEVFKVRVGNSDARKGKSGGYRVIYHVKEAEAIVLITIYSKSDQADVAAAAIRQIIADQEATDLNDADEESENEP
jgi:mRNA-degrading endonuclease RelE of RelBE toxin-antitoxin system